MPEALDISLMCPLSLNYGDAPASVHIFQETPVWMVQDLPSFLPFFSLYIV